MGDFLRILSCSTLFWLNRVLWIFDFAERREYLCKDWMLFDHTGNFVDNTAIRISWKNSGCCLPRITWACMTIGSLFLNDLWCTEVIVQHQVGNITSIKGKYLVYSNLASAKPSGTVGRSYHRVRLAHKAWVGVVNCVAQRTHFRLWYGITSICVKAITQTLVLSFYSGLHVSAVTASHH
jgi:hypothetical protein